MTTPLPQGLIRVVTTLQTEVPSDPTDVIYDRKQALHNFWKVHEIQSRTTRHASDIRCCYLFWRVWGERRLSTSLSQHTMTRLWLQCQQPPNLDPFVLRIEGCSGGRKSPLTRDEKAISKRISEESQHFEDYQATYQNQATAQHDGRANISQDDAQLIDRRDKTRVSSRTSDIKPGLTRQPSGESARKRSGPGSTAARARARPSLTRKKSSQTSQPSEETSRPRRPILKSPRSSHDDQSLAEEPFDSTSITQPGTNVDYKTTTQSPTRKMSAFELPSASSWQSVESQEQHRTTTVISSMATKSSLMVDQDFREKFVETQKVLRSTSNLVGAIRKTGSVVRFASDVDVAEQSRENIASGRHRGLATSKNEGPSSQAFSETSASTKRPGTLIRYDSAGSVAAVSDDDEEEKDKEDEEPQSTSMVLPRTRSQLSLGIADLKRSQSMHEHGVADDGLRVTSPQIEKDQQALISGKVAKQKSEEDEKLLAMAWKDGVTKAGGVNLPKELTVRGSRDPDNTFPEPEAPTF
ncbi:hypothetical protein LTR05_001042 [Lithohypha guttulata]|uniref:Uncharacterized protein n=1 Tax=Lithohypha guttulata TaxID=1690604 RepID=A0AAN7T751_9EURO|nr:hypothetical protein LTR05_001042 [Lithohypha guttulata]